MRRSTSKPETIREALNPRSFPHRQCPVLCWVDVPVAVTSDVCRDGPGWLPGVKPLVPVIEVICGVSPQFSGEFRISGFRGHLAERLQVVLANCSCKVIVDFRSSPPWLSSPEPPLQHRGRTTISNIGQAVIYLSGLDCRQIGNCFFNARSVLPDWPRPRERRIGPYSYNEQPLSVLRDSILPGRQDASVDVIVRILKGVDNLLGRLLESSPETRSGTFSISTTDGSSARHDSQESLPQISSLVFLGSDSLLDQ